MHNTKQWSINFGKLLFEFVCLVMLISRGTDASKHWNLLSLDSFIADQQDC